MRQSAKMKVDQLKYDIRHLQVSCWVFCEFLNVSKCCFIILVSDNSVPTKATTS